MPTSHHPQFPTEGASVFSSHASGSGVREAEGEPSTEAGRAKSRTR